MLPRPFSIALFTGALWFAAPASAISTVYDVTGSSLRMFNQVCDITCRVAVTGTFTLDDDGAGNVQLTELSLAHVSYAVGGTFLNLVIERSSILLGAGSVTGTGSTLGSVLFGTTTIAQTGTATCAPAMFTCEVANLPTGPTPLPETLQVDLGSWTFDALGRLSVTFNYMSVTSPPASERLTLVGSPVPEPGTITLLAIGLAALALRRRADLN